MTRIVLYWDGIIANKELAERHSAIFQKILDGHYKEANLDLKKLPNYRIYSARVNDSDRLLFTTIKTADQQSYLLLLGEVTSHDYHKSPFLKEAVLASFLDKNAKLIAEQALINEASFQIYTAPLFEPEEAVIKIENEHITSSPYCYYNNHFIQFNDSQQSALHSTLPLVISGAAGSGKSVVALSLLAYEQTLQPNKRLYLTQSKDLVDHMKQLWEKHPSAQLDKDNAIFATYDDLLLSLEPHLTSSAMYYESDFLKWFDEIYLKDFQRRHKISPNKKQQGCDTTDGLSDLFKKQKAIYQEFRIISACDTKEEYQGLGIHQSLFKKEHRAWLFSAYLKYKTYLLDKGKIDSALHCLQIENECELYDLIVVDEAQDLSHLQLKQLFRLTKESRIVYCIDTHQSLSDYQSKRPYLLNQMLHKSNIKMQSIALPGSFRCSVPIINFVNNSLSVKYCLTDGLADKKEPSVIASTHSSNEGSVHWYNTDNLNLLCKELQDTKVAVITLHQYKDEAKKLFDTPLVFTVDEIKGLEYDRVIVYNLLNDNSFKLASRLLSDTSTKANDSPKTINRPPKNSTGDEQFTTSFNRFFTACTRAINQLIVVQEDLHPIDTLIKALKKGLSQNTTSQDLPVLPKIDNVKPCWEEEANQLLNKGKLEQARNVFIEKLGKSEAEFNNIYTKKHTLNDITPKSTQIKSIKIEEHSKKLTPSKIDVNKSAKTVIIKPESKITIPIQTITAKEKKKLDYINELASTLTNERLHDFFNLKQCAELLFHTPINQHDTLISAIIINTKNMSIFINFLKNNLGVLSKLTVKSVCTPLLQDGYDYLENTSPLFFFTQNISGILLLSTLMSNSSEFTKGITADALCLSPSRKPRTPPLLILSSTHEGRLLLITLFEQSPQLSQSIPVETWNIKLNDFAPSAASFLFTSNLKEQFKKILPTIDYKSRVHGANHQTNNSDQIKKLLGNINFSQLTELFQQDKSFEFLLFQNTIGQADTLFTHIMGNNNLSCVFIDFLTHNQIYLQKLTPAILCNSFPLSEHYLSNTTPIQFLLETYSGHKLLKKFPFLLKDITAEALCQPRTEKAGALKDMSALFVLAGNSFDDPQYTILQEIICKNPLLLKKIPVEALCRTITAIKEIENMTALHYFCNHPIGRQFLYQLFDANPNLINTIPIAVWCLPLGQKASIGSQKTPIFHLSLAPDGLDLLWLIFEENSLLIESDALLNTLFRPLSDNKNNKFQNVSALYNLCSESRGCDILMLLLKNENFAKKMTASKLCYTIGSKLGKSQLTSPFYMLALTLKGRHVLTYLLKSNARLREDISIEFWRHIPKSYENSALSLFQNCAKFAGTLNSLLKKTNTERSPNQFFSSEHIETANESTSCNSSPKYAKK